MTGAGVEVSGEALDLEGLEMSLEGQGSIVTGAASGIGRMTAELFVRAGARVIGADINPADPVTPHGEMQVCQGDMSDEAFVRDLVNEAIQGGGFSSVFHCAGISGRLSAFDPTRGPELDASLETTLEIWDRTLAVNLRSGFLLLKYAMPHLVERGSGSVTFVGAAAGIYGGRVCSPAYTASKAALHGLAKWAANTHAKRNVRINVIAPGPIATPGNAKAGVGVDFVPMGRMGQTVEVARLALFLASDAGSFVTGQVWCINGGTYV